MGFNSLTLHSPLIRVCLFCFCGFCLVTRLVVVVLTTVITVTMVRGTTDDGLDTDLVDPACLDPITAGLLVGPQIAVTGEVLPLRAPGRPQVRLVLWQSNTWVRLYGGAKHTQNVFCFVSDVVSDFFYGNFLSVLRSQELNSTMRKLAYVKKCNFSCFKMKRMHWWVHNAMLYTFAKKHGYAEIRLVEGKIL